MSIARDSRLHAAVGLSLFAVIVFLLYMSSRSGQSEHDTAKRALEAVEFANVQLDMGLFPLLFEFRMDFDDFTQTELELREAADAFQALMRSTHSETLADLIRRKLVATGDFKAEHSILRNSRAIADQMMTELWESPALEDRSKRDDLFNVERAFLDFIARRDPPTAIHLRDTVASVGARNPELAGTEQWQVLVAHVAKLLETTVVMTELLQGIYMLPIPPTVLRQADLLAAELARATIVAGHYRSALFFVAMLLLAFSALKVVEVRRYMQLLHSVNNELEERVQERTRQLADAHESLVDEMAERENVMSQLRIAQKLESIGQLAAGIAHEINTPAQYVSDNVAYVESVWRDIAPLLDVYEQAMTNGLVDAAESRAPWERADVEYNRTEVPAALRQARDGLGQIADIVMAVKNFSHPGSGELEAADINSAIRNTALVARNEWKYVAELTLELDPSLPAVACDVSAFNQVVLNLIVNAAQAIGERGDTSKTGHITVATRRDGNYVEICVEDDGPGVAEGLRERIFDPFFTTKPVGKGTGQGLAIAHRIVTRHGGTLTVERGTAKGALFRVRLPLVADGNQADDMAVKVAGLAG